MKLKTILVVVFAVAFVAPPTSFTAQMCGDADGNGTVTVTDGVQTLRAAAALSTLCTTSTCDVDGSGVITVTDGVNVLRLAAGLSVDSHCPISLDLSGRFMSEHSRCVDQNGNPIAVEEGSVVIVQAGDMITLTVEQSGLRYRGTLTGDQFEVRASLQAAGVTCMTTLTGTAFGSDRAGCTENITCADGSAGICSFQLARLP